MDADPSTSSSHAQQQTRRATAFHEAGHAVVAMMLGRPIEKVTIVAAQMTVGARLGACKVQKGKRKASQDAVESEVLILLAGMVAESFVTGRYCEAGAAQDLAMVQRLLANRAPKQHQLERLAKRMLAKTEHLVFESSARTAIEQVAEELLDRDSVSGRTVRHCMQQAGIDV